jgi:hypothetical protein
MRTVRMLALAVLGLFILVACNDAAGDLEDVPTTLPDAAEVGDAFDEVRNDIEQLATEIENSEAADDLQAQWEDVRADITAAIDSATTDGSIDTTGLEETMDDFQAELEAAGDEFGDEAMAIWTRLRSQIEQLAS